MAVHFQAGGEPGKAGDYAVQAAERASGALAFEAAVRCYRMALALRSGETPEAQALRVKLADALIERGIPIVFLSSYSLNIAPRHLRERPLVHKPFSTHSLVEAIRAQAAGKQTTAAPQPPIKPAAA